MFKHTSKVRVRIAVERKRLSLASSHVTTLETNSKEAQTEARVLFSPFPPLPTTAQRKARKNRFFKFVSF